jgi:hypothetical protein
MEYKLVPVEPDNGMTQAGQSTLHTAGPFGLRVAANSTYKAMLAAAPAPAWVPVSERLPTREDADNDESVWAWLGAGPVELLYYGSIGSRYADVTHWMPRPQQMPPDPPKEKK